MQLCNPRWWPHAAAVHAHDLTVAILSGVSWRFCMLGDLLEGALPMFWEIIYTLGTGATMGHKLIAVRLLPDLFLKVLSY